MKKNAFPSYAQPLASLLGFGALLLAFSVTQVNDILLQIVMVLVLLVMAAGIGACIAIGGAHNEAMNAAAREQWGKRGRHAHEL